MMDNGGGGAICNPPAKWHSFKMILDPLIHQGVRKTLRYDGCVTVPPGGAGGAVTINPSDPRSKLPPALVRWRRLECVELPVPRFRIDENYVGEPPKVEVTLENLNDNVDKTFLERMISKYGAFEELEIYYHPVRRKHLGLARIVFELVRSAKECVKELHGKSVMGKRLNCYIDPFFASAKKMYAELTAEKKDEPPPAHRSEDDREQSPSKDSSKRGASSFRGDPRDRRNSRDYDRRRDSYDGSRERTDERSNFDFYSHEYSQQRHPQPSQISAQQHHHPTYPPPSSSQASGDSQFSSEIDYWQHQAAIFAQHQQPLPQVQHRHTPSSEGDRRHEAPRSEEQRVNDEDSQNDKEDEEEDAEEEKDHKLDLDTRLKLLMKKGSGSGLMPAFLLNELNSEDEEDNKKTDETKVNGFVGNSREQLPLPELSRPPSPFLSKEAFDVCDTAWVNERKNLCDESSSSQIGKSEFSKETQRNQIFNNGKRPTSRESDQMSLSSLSSGEDKILHQQQQVNNYPHVPAYSTYPSAPYSFPYPGGWGYEPYQQQWQIQNHIIPHPAGYPHQSIPPPPLSFDRREEMDGKKSPHNNKIPNMKDHYLRILNESVDVFVRDLKRTVRRDMTKKIGETFAFNLYDKWWQAKENDYKRKLLTSQQRRSSSNSSKTESNKVKTITDDNSRIPKTEDLNSLFDKQRDLSGVSGSGSSFGTEGSLGFGFRGSIPKLPSFKKKPVEKKRSDSSDDSSRRRDEHHRRRHRDSDRHRRRSGSTRHDRRQSRDRRDDASSSSSRRRSHSRSSASRSDRKSSRSERRKEYEIRRDKRLKDKHCEDELPPPPPPPTPNVKEENKKMEEKKADEKDVTPPPTKTKSQAIYSSSSEDDEIIVKDFKNKDRKNKESPIKKHVQKPNRKKIIVSSGEEDGASSHVEEEPVPVVNSTTSSEAEVSEEVESNKKSSNEESNEIDNIGSSLKEKISSTNSSTSSSSSSSTSSTSSSSSSDEAEQEEGTSSTKHVTKKPSLTALATQRESSTDSAVDEEEEEKQSPPHIMDHCYAAAPPGSSLPVTKKRQNSFAEDFANDHGYTKPRSPPPPLPPPPPPPPPPERKEKKKKSKPAEAPLNAEKWSLRDPKEQFGVVYRFLTQGLDLEDLKYLKSCYEMMLSQHSNNKNMMWMNDTHWVDHPVTEFGGTPPPPKRRRKDDFSRVHATGSCRTEGYYKMDHREKMRTKYHLHRDPNSFLVNKIANLEGAATRGKIVSAQNLSREARNNQRRQLAVLGDDALNSDLLKFNQLKFRRKQMTFGKSAIHDWGLFAMEDIGADEMVIEYVGSVIRPLLSDVRENRYEKQGIGSSYLFRIDSEYVVDATKCGNLARFINHSCDPNCYAKIITIDGAKKIVIYSKQPIAFGEEITYDYKFPIEDEKIRCLCGSKNCRKYLN